MSKTKTAIGWLFMWMIGILFLAEFVAAVYIAISPSNYDHECPAVTLQDQYGMKHEIQANSI